MGSTAADQARDRRRLLRNIEAEAQKLGCQVLAINCTEDHVHVLLALPTAVAIANLVKQMKGVSVAQHGAGE